MTTELDPPTIEEQEVARINNIVVGLREELGGEIPDRVTKLIVALVTSALALEEVIAERNKRLGLKNSGIQKTISVVNVAFTEDKT